MEAHRLRLTRGAALLPTILLAACGGGQRGLYRWGPYEDSVYALCSAPDAVDLQGEIERLSALVSAAAQSEGSVPPGVHAHLGYLFALAGDLDAAVAAFESEKELYTESSVFVDGVLARMRAGAERRGATP